MSLQINREIFRISIPLQSLHMVPKKYINSRSKHYLKLKSNKIFIKKYGSSLFKNENSYEYYLHIYKLCFVFLIQLGHCGPSYTIKYYIITKNSYLLV